MDLTLSQWTGPPPIGQVSPSSYWPGAVLGGDDTEKLCFLCCVPRSSLSLSLLRVWRRVPDSSSSPISPVTALSPLGSKGNPRARSEHPRRGSMLVKLHGTICLLSIRAEKFPDYLRSGPGITLSRNPCRGSSPWEQHPVLLLPLLLLWKPSGSSDRKRLGKRDQLLDSVFLPMSHGHAPSLRVNQPGDRPLPDSRPIGWRRPLCLLCTQITLRSPLRPASLIYSLLSGGGATAMTDDYATNPPISRLLLHPAHPMATTTRTSSVYPLHTHT